MYSQPHHGLIFQNQPSFFLNAPLQGCEINHVTLGPLWHWGGRLLSYSRNTASDLMPSPSLPTPTYPQSFILQLPHWLLFIGLPLSSW